MVSQICMLGADTAARSARAQQSDHSVNSLQNLTTSENPKLCRVGH